MSGKVVVVPTVKEAEKLFENIAFYEWKYGILKGIHNRTPVYICGISKSNAAFSAPFIISEHTNSNIIMTGICGAYRESGLSVGEVVSIEKDYFVDEASYENGVLKNIGDQGFPVIENNYSFFRKIPELKVVNSNTVSFLSTDERIEKEYYNFSCASVENMEGAAFGLAANRMGVHIYQVRAVSNYCGPRKQQEWNINFSFESLKNYFKTII